VELRCPPTAEAVSPIQQFRPAPGTCRAGDGRLRGALDRLRARALMSGIRRHESSSCLAEAQRRRGPSRPEGSGVTARILSLRESHLTPQHAHARPASSKLIGRYGALLPLFRLAGVPCIAAFRRVKSHCVTTAIARNSQGQSAISPVRPLWPAFFRLRSSRHVSSRRSKAER
jgi:hypothetical protein